MPVFNGERFLREAIQSVLQQTYQNFEFLIFNDGSTDGTKSIIDSFDDPRIRAFHDSSNKGYVSRLNEAINISRGEYFARMDADDVCFESRLEQQVAFMHASKEVGICGTQILEIDEYNIVLNEGAHFTDDSMLRLRLLQDACFAHSSVMMRKSVLAEHKLFYDEKLMPAEDYGLWVELSKHTKLANLPLVLLKYRIHSKQTTAQKRSLQKNAANKVRIEMLESFLGRPADVHEKEIHTMLLGGDYTISRESIVASKDWIRYLMRCNESIQKFNGELLENFLSKIWFSLCTHAHQLGPWVIRTYLTSGIKRQKIAKTSTLKFLAKSLLPFSQMGPTLKK